MQPRRKDRPQSVVAFLALLDKEPVVADIDDDEDTVIEIEPKPKPQPQPAPKPAPQPTPAPSKNKWLVPTLIAVVVALAIIFWPKGGSEEPVLPTADTSTVASVVVEDSMPLAPVKEEVPVMSSLYVTTSPVGATVKVDGKTIGKSPIEGKELAAGKHTIQITLDGYENISEKLTFTHKPMVLNKTLQAKQVKAEANTSASVASTTSGNKRTFTVNGVNFTMIHVAGGTFQMGSNDSDAYDDEKPVHSVTLSSYSIGETEVTQALWTAVMGSNPSDFKGNNLPVEEVSWNDCQTFIRKLNSLTGENFRLPTEAEWEFAARGGNRSRGYKYSGSDNLGDVAWYFGNSGGKTHAVKSKSPNELGIYDMSGNVWEWCSDWYGSYSSSSVTNPKGPSSGSHRVNRGGSWSSNARYCRVAYRYYDTPSYTFNFLGLRLVL